MQVYLATVIGQLQVSNDDEFAVNILQKYIGGPRTGTASVSGGNPSYQGLEMYMARQHRAFRRTKSNPGLRLFHPLLRRWHKCRRLQ